MRELEYICSKRLECDKSKGCTFSAPTYLNENQIAENFECEIYPNLGKLKKISATGRNMADEKISTIHKSIVRLEGEVKEKEDNLRDLSEQLKETKNYYRGLFEMHELLEQK